MQDNKFQPNYIKCPECKNILDLSYIDKCCPNPLCGFNFAGLEPYLRKGDEELHKDLMRLRAERSGHEFKLLITAVKFNMGNYLAHFIECTWGAHYNTLYKDFILYFLDDLNLLKAVLKSDVIKDKDNTVVSKNGYKMFWELYCRLKKTGSTSDIRGFLVVEFPELHRKHYIECREKHLKLKVLTDNKGQASLL